MIYYQEKLYDIHTMLYDKALQIGCLEDHNALIADKRVRCDEDRLHVVITLENV